MTELLYLNDSYAKTFDAHILEIIDGKKIILDRTLFYVQGGGQPYDVGILTSNGATYVVKSVTKKDGKVLHEVDKDGLPNGGKVHGQIDWARRYQLMRMHTAAHLIAGIVSSKLTARITGNQLDLDKSRIDFDLEGFDRAKVEECFALANTHVEQDLPVTAYVLPREEALKIPGVVKLANVLPPTISELRIVQIGDVDVQADGGTHVKSLKEVGRLTFLSADNKGKNNRRVYFSLATV